MKAVIKGIGAYVPERIMTNEEFAEFVDTSDEWIVSHTGISTRRIATDDQAASDLGFHAAQKALKRSGIAAENLNLIITATTTADYKGFPSTACIIQEKLGAVNAGAFDLSAACTGFIYGLEIARNFIENRSAQNILVIGTEKLTSIVDWTDRNTCVLFGDGSGAVIVSATEHTDRGIIYSVLQAEGSGSEFLKIPVGGSRTPFQQGQSAQNIYLTMDGRPVYNFATRVITQVIKKIMDDNALKIEDIASIVPHQANFRIIQAAAKRLGIPIEKFKTNLSRVANTSAASIPIAWNEMVEENELREGDLIITVGFGGGLTYGGNLIRL